MKFADECASILRSVAEGNSYEGVSLEQIMDDTGLPSVQIVDLIENYLAKNVKVIQARFRGRKVTRYVAIPT